MRVVVIGAGIAGLAAAHALRNQAPDIAVTVVDGATQIGGKLRVSDIGGVAVDEGAEAFVLRAPEGQALARDVGLGDQLVTPAASSAHLLVRGELRPLPSGTLLGIPADPHPIAAALGEEAARSVAEEPSLPGEPVTEDVAVGELVRRRLGDQIADGLVDPLLGGVYAGHADRLSLRATMPAIAARLSEDPSLVRAAAAALDAARSDGPVFGSLRGGMGSLADAVLRASGAELRLGLPVREVLTVP
ncbi:MAG: protoporphyrinogen oxidase, partial [Micromonosporaceae bacterium]|nr:protoporphyrinogen oxidase [Micromonosporaceae bacterium]